MVKVRNVVLCAVDNGDLFNSRVDFGAFDNVPTHEKNSVSGLKMSMVSLAHHCHALSLTALSWFESYSSVLV